MATVESDHRIVMLEGERDEAVRNLEAANISKAELKVNLFI